ncbi:MAG: hypothetical protein Q7R86_01120, partial [bacterium]|nr:hypothetical protein [bacterium]
GCVSMKNGKYCILNKQYSPSEYKTLKEEIKSHMLKTGEYGEFFPPKLSPFGYNETQGQVYMPFNSKEEAIKEGWKWEDTLNSGTFGKETVILENIPDSITDIQDSFLKEIIACSNCNKNYKITPNELNFYRKESIPIPRLCPDCRYRDRLNLRPPRKLWHRACMCLSSEDPAKGGGYQSYKNTATHFHGEGKCPNEFETSYSPDRKEIVYCEQCYQAEVV